MRTSSFRVAKASLISLMLLLGPGAALKATAQLSPILPTGLKTSEVTTNDLILPLVYGVENSGSSVALTFPAIANLPIIRPLPDPFMYLSTGTRDTSFASWEQHRNEISAAFQNYMVGPKPDCHDCTITASYLTTSSNHYTLTVKVTRNGLTTTLTSAIVTPSGTPPASGWPFIMKVDSSGILPSTDSAYLATVPFTSSQVTTSDSPKATDGFYQLYPDLCSYQCPNQPPIPGSDWGGGSLNGNSGQFAAWAWGVSRLLDGLQIVTTQLTNPLPINMGRSAITGCSYAGKLALWAGALDERITLTIPEEPGGGGVANWRYSFNVDAEAALGVGSHVASAEDVDSTDHKWWSDAGLLDQFMSVDVYKLPIDLHEVAAMVAPRALVETGNTEYYNLANGSNYVSARAIQKVYNTFGIGDRFGFVIDGNHGHCSPPSTETAYVAQFINKFLLGQNVSTDVEVYPAQPTDGSGNPKHYYPINFATMDYQRWTSWWGTDSAQFPNDWNTGGTADLWFNNPITINTGDTVAAGYAIQMPATNHPAATVKLNNAHVQTDVTCNDGSSYTLEIPLYATYGTGQSYTIPAGNTSWYPSSDPTNAATYQGSISGTGGTVPVITSWNDNVKGSIVNPGCANGAPGRAGRAYFVALGAQDGTTGDPAGPGFVTTDTTQSPLAVRFHLADATTGQGGAWSAPITVNQLPIN